MNRQYEPIVRINSQSGKGGVAFVMDTVFGYHLPKALQADFAKAIQDISETEGEVSPDVYKRQGFLTHWNQTNATLCLWRFNVIADFLIP